MSGFLYSAALLAFALPAQAVTVTVEEFNTGDPAVLVIGHFEAGDDNVFRAQTASLRSALVVFISDGGNADVAFAIGRIIRAKGFATGVTGTYCYSACAIAWLGGVRRYMSVNSHIGFHAVWDINTRRESGSGNAMLGLYATEMGLSWPAVAWISAKGPTELNMLTKAEADRLGIAVDVYDAGTSATRAAVQHPVAVSAPYRSLAARPDSSIPPELFSPTRTIDTPPIGYQSLIPPRH